MASAASAPAASSSAPATIAAHRSSRSNVSSRPWKVVQTARFSAMTRPKAIGGARRGAAFNEQKARKRTLLQGRSELQTHKDAKLHQRGLEREQRLEKERQRAANLLKGQSYQTISDPTKLKKMTKKQLRNVKRTVVDKDGITKLVPAYSK